MTEAEWLASAEPAAMLTFVTPRTTERKLLLFGCACTRRVMPEMDHDGSRELVELVEQHIEGLISAEMLRDIAREHDRYCSSVIPEWEYVNSADMAAISTAYGALFIQHVPGWVVRGKVRPLLRPISVECAQQADLLPSPFHNNTPVSPTALMDWAEARKRCDEPWVRAEAEFTAQEQTIQAAFVRDIFGNPFRPVAFDPSWRSEAVVALARGIYDDRAFDRLPVLADALEDAGCGNADLLTYCRSDGPHVRGCWAVDLILGKS